MMPVDRRKQDDDELDVSPYDGLQKNAVLHEAKVFNDQQIDPATCSRVMTKILYLISKGEEFTAREAVDVFFSVTKLFQSPDVHLRRLTYLLIKELKVASDQSLIVTASLSKDMVSHTDMFRANSIRVLAKIIDGSMLGQIDRFLKQAVVDKNPFVVSSALMAGIHLVPTCPDVIRRWVSEVQSALNNKNHSVQFHALLLLYLIKRHDRLAISKVVTAMSRNAPSGPMATCLLIRYTAAVLASQPQPDQELLKFLGDCLHKRSFMVMYEAARALCRLPNLGANHVSPAIAVLQEFLTSPVPTQRFAAVRTLSQVVSRFPALVSPCSIDLEHLITDQNRSIATLAITTLLKTGVEANVDRLMKSITGFMSEISDEFKTVLVDAIRTLALKFPAKYPALMSFLAGALREEGGFEYKSAIVNAILAMISAIPGAKEEGLDHFCEFIEDCEFSALLVKILHFLGKEGPSTPNPSKYIRFIFNRVILEKACVRSAAVSALASFGAQVPALTQHIVVLLQRAANDNDDEVRDRVTYYLSVLGNDQETSAVMHSELDVPLTDLEVSLRLYLEKNPRNPFNLKEHIVEAAKAPAPAQEETKDDLGMGMGMGVGGGLSAVNADGVYENPYKELLNSIPEFAALGPVFHSCNPVQLTEEESEYLVSCVKHIYDDHVVFQFNVTNNMEDQLLEQVTVEMEATDEEWEEELIVPEAKLAYGASGVTFVCMKKPAGVYNSGTLSAILKFEARETDGEDVSPDSSEESYQLEDVEMTEKDFMKRGDVLGVLEFRKQWESLNGSEEVKKYSLGLQDLQEAVNAVMELLGMAACEDSGTVPEDKRSHLANLYGVFHPGVKVYCRAGFMLDAKHGVTLKIAIRCQDQDLARQLAACIR